MRCRVMLTMTLLIVHLLKTLHTISQRSDRVNSHVANLCKSLPLRGTGSARAGLLRLSWGAWPGIRVALHAGAAAGIIMAYG